MRAVIQRVKQASVEVEGKQVGAIGQGLLVLLGVGREDTDAEVIWMADKLPELRLFEDADGKMNCSARTLGLPLLVVSQFTLYGDAHKGRRPGFTAAAPPEEAEARYQQVVARLREGGMQVETGIFRADMQVALVNDGPVTLWLDTAHR
jgi:D-tyrosyl-tRNA(Tyr) deacylase